MSGLLARRSSSSSRLPLTVSAPSPPRRSALVTFASLLGIVVFGGIVTGITFVSTTSYPLSEIPLPVPQSWREKLLSSPANKVVGDAHAQIDDVLPQMIADGHPIRTLMTEADAEFERYYNARPKTFKECVHSYREKYGRHPPPGFDKWYLFARERGAVHLEDFDQIMDDLRPFWSYSPRDLRRLVKGMLAEEYSVMGLGSITVKDGSVSKSDDNWRTVELERMVKNVVKGLKKVGMPNGLPDMTIAMNRHDQPRVVVPWEDMQKALKVEEASRSLTKPVKNEFTKAPVEEVKEGEELPKGEWFKYPGKQYMDLVSKACPPESYARNAETMDQHISDSLYKLEDAGGIVKNFNLSRDLCTVGPAIKDKHGLLFASSTLTETHKLVPVFGECKISANNDILFPANMYYKTDPRYDYSDDHDLAWDQKDAKLFWRGITSGGTQVAESWRRLHRHRLVLLTNTTDLRLTNTSVSVLTALPGPSKNTTLYHPKPDFSPQTFAATHTDVGFHSLQWCVPDINCGWLHTLLAPVPATTLSQQFIHKFLIDVDGHSFSGRWNAFLRSRSLGLKATIFREWHDSRLHAWRHFAPLDNRFDDLYALLTYFVGWEDPLQGVSVAAHDGEAARMAAAGREWAQRVLRREDMEVYVARLLLEYGRLLDDERDGIGYGGDGSEVEEKEEWRGEP
ncbi:hypothetical protein EDC01DRAFT_637947 [Geopyxis carbonaria]|nr:hypothetical protein EDC01DRAFT_637947 [Geopyxis carbonaria]